MSSGYRCGRGLMDRGEAVFDEKPKKQTVRLKKKGSEIYHFPCNISHEKFHESY